jgi:hypothetical protein
MRLELDACLIFSVPWDAFLREPKKAEKENNLGALTIRRKEVDRLSG